MAMQQAIK